MADHRLQVVANRTLPNTLHRAMRFCAVCVCSRPLRDFALNAAGTPSHECLGCVRVSIPIFVHQVNLHVQRVRNEVGTLRKRGTARMARLSGLDLYNVRAASSSQSAAYVANDDRT